MFIRLVGDKFKCPVCNKDLDASDGMIVVVCKKCGIQSEIPSEYIGKWLKSLGM